MRTKITLEFDLHELNHMWHTAAKLHQKNFVEFERFEIVNETISIKDDLEIMQNGKAYVYWFSSYLESKIAHAVLLDNKIKSLICFDAGSEEYCIVSEKRWH